MWSESRSLELQLVNQTPLIGQVQPILTDLKVVGVRRIVTRLTRVASQCILYVTVLLRLKKRKVNRNPDVTT